MEKILILTLIVLSSQNIFCQNSSTKKYDVLNAVEINVGDALELRDKESLVGKVVDSIRNKYNKTNVSKIGKSQLIFQPKGTDVLNKKAIDDVTRIKLKYIQSNKNQYPKYDEGISLLKLSGLNKFLKAKTIKTFKKMPYTVNLIKWNPIITGKIDNQYYIKTSLIMEINNIKTYMEEYQFYNSDEKVFLTLSTGYPVKKKWITVFHSTVNSFNFKDRK